MIGSLDSHKTNKYRKLITLPAQSNRYQPQIIEKQQIKVSGFPFRRKIKQNSKITSSLSSESIAFESKFRDQTEKQKKTKLDALIKQFKGSLMKYENNEDSQWSISSNEEKDEYQKRVKQSSAKLFMIYLTRVLKTQEKCCINSIKEFNEMKQIQKIRKEKIEINSNRERRNLINVNRLFASKN